MPWQRDTPPISSEILAIHIALLPRGDAGEVLLLGGNEHWANQTEVANPNNPAAYHKTRIFDVQSRQLLRIPIDLPESDVFCSGHAQAADGQLLIIGGTHAFPQPPHLGHAIGFIGHRRCYLFHTSTHKWAKAAQMLPGPNGIGGGWWYPGAITLGDGDIVAFFGHISNGDSRHRNTTPERYNVNNNTWTRLPNMANDGPTYLPFASGPVRLLMYPRTFVMPDGRLFFATPMPTDWEAHTDPVNPSDGPHQSTFYDPFTGKYVGTPIADEPTDYTGWDFPCVLLPLLPSEGYRPRVLHCGAKEALRIDLGLPAPLWEIAAEGAMRVNRFNSCAVLLPTAQVCLVGGVKIVKPDNEEKIPTELYDPDIDWSTGQYRAGLGRWKTDPDMPANSRNYHSAAMLLPNGQVLTCGGNKNACSGNPDLLGIKVIELYNPLYPAGNRLTISDLPLSVTYGHSFTVTSSDPADIRRVALIRNGSCTHAYDFDQRYVGLNFTYTAGDNHIIVAAPPNGNVAPPGYYMLWTVDSADRPCQLAKFIRVAYQTCTLVTDRSTFSSEEVQAASVGDTATFENAIYLVFDGFIHTEITTAPTFEVRWADPPNDTVPLNDLTLIAAPRLLEVNPGNEDIPQRITYPFHVRFSNPNFFGSFLDTKRVQLTFRLGQHVCTGRLNLTHTPSPYMTDINPLTNNPFWLSTDVRVFSIEAGQLKFANVLQGADDPIPFIQKCIELLNTPGQNGNGLFEDLSTDGTLEAATLGPSNKPVFNYAIARVRYCATSTLAERVRCFFRIFSAALTGLDFDPKGTYNRTTAGPSTVPLLGRLGAKVVSVPFFASERVETVTGSPGESSMQAQTLASYESRTIIPINGAEVSVFFGAWLDINQTRKRFPLTVDPTSPDGPYSPLAAVPILEHLRSRHPCIIAEIFFEKDLINFGDTPSSSDKLAQRNLVVMHADNPGTEASHTSMHTLMIKPSMVFSDSTGLDLAGKDGQDGEQAPLVHRTSQTSFVFDELLFHWHNLPRSSTVTLTFSSPITTTLLQSLANSRLSPLAAVAIDETTFSLPVSGPSGLTYLSVPPLPGDAQIPSLLSITIPAEDARAGRVYRVSVQQVNGHRGLLIGSVEFRMRVSKRELILDEETRTLSVFRYIAGRIPRDDYWWEIMQLYVKYMANKVDALGGRSGDVNGNPDGSGRPHDPGPAEDCTCCDGDRMEREDEWFIGNVCMMQYGGDGKFVGFTLKLCRVMSKEKGMKIGGKKFFESREECVEKVIITARSEGRKVKVVIGPSSKGGWKGIKCLMICCHD